LKYINRKRYNIKEISIRKRRRNMNEIYQNELARSKIYTLLKCKCDGLSDGIGSSVIKLVNEVVSESCELSKTIIKYMPEYTLHDATHLFESYRLWKD